MPARLKMFETVTLNFVGPWVVYPYICVQFEAASCNISKAMGINVKIQIWLANNDFHQIFDRHIHVT